MLIAEYSIILTSKRTNRNKMLQQLSWTWLLYFVTVKKNGGFKATVLLCKISYTTKFQDVNSFVL